MVYEPYIYSNDMRALEACAVESGMSYAELMRNAGASAAEYLMNTACITNKSSVLIMCGTGNNGGDGYVMGRCFAARFTESEIVILAVGSLPKTDLAYSMYEQTAQCSNIKVLLVENPEDIALCKDMIDRASVFVDAVYGIGFHGSLPDLTGLLFSCISDRLASRTTPYMVVAVDVPSGMGADNGQWDARSLKVDVTLTFASPKRCMMKKISREQCGDIVVIDIGIASDMVARFQVAPNIVTRDYAAQVVPRRVQNSHKGTYGSVYSLSGSYGMAGAAMLSAMAALRCGIGLLHMLIPKTIYPIVSSQIWEAVYHPLDETISGGLSMSGIDSIIAMTTPSKTASFLCGPGLSRNKDTQKFVRELLARLSIPLVVDADGLNAFVGHIDEWKAISAQDDRHIITPHPGEAARLLSCTVDEIEADRIASAKRLVNLMGATVVLKGQETVIAGTDGRVCINTTGCSGLAKGGSGDVLAGMIAAMVAQGVESFRAAVTCVYFHGLASLRASDTLGQTSMLPSDLLPEVAKLLSEYEE